MYTYAGITTPPSQMVPPSLWRGGEGFLSNNPTWAVLVQL